MVSRRLRVFRLLPVAVVLGLIAACHAEAQVSSGVSADRSNDWCVYQKTSCGPLCAIASRNDWLVVARCSDIVTTTGSPCGLQLIPEQHVPTDFQSALQLRAYVAMTSGRFEGFCCKDYIRWFSAQDRSTLICTDRMSSPGPGWYQDTPNPLGCWESCAATTLVLASPPGAVAIRQSNGLWSSPTPIVIAPPGFPPIALGPVPSYPSVANARRPPPEVRRPGQPPVGGVPTYPPPADSRRPPPEVIRPSGPPAGPGSSSAPNDPLVGSYVSPIGATVVLRADRTGTWVETRPGQPGTWQGTWEGSWDGGNGWVRLTPNDSARFGGSVSFTVRPGGRLIDPWNNTYTK